MVTLNTVILCVLNSNSHRPYMCCKTDAVWHFARRRTCIVRYIHRNVSVLLSVCHTIETTEPIIKQSTQNYCNLSTPALWRHSRTRYMSMVLNGKVRTGNSDCTVISRITRQNLYRASNTDRKLPRHIIYDDPCRNFHFSTHRFSEFLDFALSLELGISSLVRALFVVCTRW